MSKNIESRPYSWDVPVDAVDVLIECVDESWRTVEQNGDYARPVDIAADIVRRLTAIYGL